MDLLRSLPLGLYLEQPLTWLHHLDPRVKLAWLMSFLLAPVLANPLWRIALAAMLILLTFSALIPWRIWRQQMVWLLTLSSLIFILIAISPDGLPADHQPRLPAEELTLGQSPLAPITGNANQDNPVFTPQPSPYSYILFQQGPVKITRKSLDLAINVSTLLFTLVYSTNLYLLTTAPEEITAGLESLMLPFKALNWPITEIILTLTLSLRFIPLVLEEIQNLVRSIWTRAINWQKLGMKKSLQVWLIVVERLLENLLLRAEQIASAMKVRGFTTPNQHRVQWHQLHLHWGDWLALTSLVIFWGSRMVWGWQS
jgi:energy-coupling factor transport system permease protein